MTAEEKFSRLIHPQCAEDYGLSIGLEEMRTVPEAREIVWVVDAINEGAAVTEESRRMTALSVMQMVREAGERAAAMACVPSDMLGKHDDGGLPK